MPPCFWPAGWPGGGWPGAVMFPHGQASVGWPGATHGARNGHSVPWLPHAKRKVTVPVACSTNRRHCVFTCPRRCSTWMTKAGAGGGRRGWAAAPPVPSGCDPRPAPPPVAAPPHRKHSVAPLNLRAIGPVISLPIPILVPPGTKIGHTHGRSLLSENRQYHGQIETTLKRRGRAGTDLCPTWDKDWSHHRPVPGRELPRQGPKTQRERAGLSSSLPAGRLPGSPAVASNREVPRTPLHRVTAATLQPFKPRI